MAAFAKGQLVSNCLRPLSPLLISDDPRSYSRLLAYEASRILFRLGCDVRVFDPRELPVVPLAQPLLGVRFGAPGDAPHLDSRGGVESVEEPHGRGVAGAAAQERPGLAAYVVGRDQRVSVVRCEQGCGVLVSGVAAVGERDSEGRVDKDQGP